MERAVGVVCRGLLAPIINSGDDIVKIATDILLEASKKEGFNIEDGDILGVTESVVARSQGNYAKLETIAQDIQDKFGYKTIGIVFPILSRNRFAPILEGIARSKNQLILLLSYPLDEVGNRLADETKLEEGGVNMLVDVFTYEEFIKKFGTYKHKFTGIDYIEYYNSIIKKYNSTSHIILANNAKIILEHTNYVLSCDIHTRKHTKAVLKDAGARIVLSLDDILTKPIDSQGYNAEYGLLGSNKADEERLKLFPRDGMAIVEKIQKLILQKTGKCVEVLIYGDGAFRDPVGHIWELADPVVSPAFTQGLMGLPSEIKLKYLADNDLKGLPKDELEKKMREYIMKRKEECGGGIDAMVSEGTTPRKLVDLVGSLCDLTSGSGDKGTPFVYIKNYFKKWSD